MAIKEVTHGHKWTNASINFSGLITREIMTITKRILMGINFLMVAINFLMVAMIFYNF